MPGTQTVRFGLQIYLVMATQNWNLLPSHLNNINVSHEQFKFGLELALCASPSPFTGGASENLV